MKSGSAVAKKPRKNEEASPSVTFFILVTFGVLVLSIGGMLLLESNPWVSSQKLWLVSRAASIAAFVVLTLVVVLGILISHPRNKDRWKFTKHLFPWHQALLASMFALIGIHLWFTGSDPKSGLTFSQMLFPLHSQYHPLAMMAGAFGLYFLIVVSLTAALRRWVSKVVWLSLHRASWLVWVLVLLHGVVGGSDSAMLRPLYAGSGVMVFTTFFWRHWVNPGRTTATTRVEPTEEKGVQA